MKVSSPIGVSSSVTRYPSEAQPSANVFSPNLAGVLSPVYAYSVKALVSSPSHVEMTSLTSGYVGFFVTSRIQPFSEISGCFPGMVEIGVATASSW